MVVIYYNIKLIINRYLTEDVNKPPTKRAAVKLNNTGFNYELKYF